MAGHRHHSFGNCPEQVPARRTRFLEPRPFRVIGEPEDLAGAEHSPTTTAISSSVVRCRWCGRVRWAAKREANRVRRVPTGVLMGKSTS